MNVTSARPIRSLFPFILLALLFLTACGVNTANSNWPGLSADGDVVYVAYGPGIIAVDTEARRQLWAYPEDPGATPFFASPSVSEERIVIGDYGRPGGFLSPATIVNLYAVANEKEVLLQGPPTLWQDESLADDKIVAPPLQAAGLVFVGTADNNLLALDADSGALVWQFETEHSIWARPTFVDGLLFVASMDKHLYALNAEDGSLVWVREFEGALPKSAVHADGVLYVGSFDNQLHAVNAADGDIIWSAPAGNWVWAAPAVADGVVYYADFDGTVYAVNGADGRELWTANASGPVHADVLVADGLVFIASVGPNEDNGSGNGQLLALRASDGRQEWSVTTTAPLHSTPVLTDEEIVIALEQQGALLEIYDRLTGVERWEFIPVSTQ